MKRRKLLIESSEGLVVNPGDSGSISSSSSSNNNNNDSTSSHESEDNSNGNSIPTALSSIGDIIEDIEQQEENTEDTYNEHDIDISRDPCINADHKTNIFQQSNTEDDVNTEATDSSLTGRWNKITELHPRWQKTVNLEFGHLIYASLTSYQNKLILFGGYDTDNNDFNKLTAYLDINTNQWHHFKDNNAPCARDNHSAVIYKQSMIIFGGNGISGDYLSDTYCLDLVTMKWEQKITKGRKPIGRSRHSAFIHEDKMYIHGGKRHNKILSSVASLDLKTWTWSQQYEFYPKVAHYNFIYKDLLYCYGGFKSIRYILEENESNMLCFLNLKTGEKGILSLESNKAPEIENEMDYIEQTRMRVNFASACCLYQNKLVVVIPPCEPNGYLMGIYSLDLNTFTWNQHLNKEDGILLGSKPNESNNDSVSDMSSSQNDITNNSVGFVDNNGNNFNNNPIIIVNNSGNMEVNINSRLKLKYKTYFAMNNELEEFYLIGANVENKKNYLGSLLKIDLMEYGLFFNNQQTNTLSLPQSSLNFHNMFGNELMSDFKIYSNEKEQSYIPAHKFLLMTRWEHFKNLQDSGMKESELSYFIIPEAYNTTYHFLKYLYTDQLTTNNTHIIANLLVLGNLYDMKPLQMMCGEYLHQNIKVENVAHIYYQATKANELGLKKRAIKFMFHNFGKVVKSKGYQALSRQALIDFWCNLPTYAKIIA